jgi:pimeloyl-ACP methyl ester carboxylesterase
VAQHLALAARARVKSLALLCTVARGRDATRLSWRMLWLGLGSRLGTRRSRRRAFLRIVLPPAAVAGADLDALAARLEPLFGHDLADAPPITMRQLGALRAYDATARLAELAGIPTLVASATHDPIAPPRFGRALAAAIPGARFVEHAGASHGVPIHGAEEVNTLLAEHLAAADAVL